MEETKWQDPVFGYVPKEFRSWYEQESGTYWDGKQKRWRIAKDIMGTWYSSKDTRREYPINSYVANVFQDRYKSARELIEDRLRAVDRKYIISQGDIFSLMRDKVVIINYRIDGIDYQEEIRL